MTRIAFSEENNEIIKKAIKRAQDKFDDFEPVFAKSLEEACARVRDGEADALVTGIDYTSREVILSCRDIIGKSSRTFSASFVLERNNEVYVLGDAAACKNPTEEQLYDIVVQTYQTAKAILKDEPRLAVLSFSTLGSGGNDPSISKTHNVVNRIHEDYPEIQIDGELQLDAAIVKEIGDKKAPGSTVAGKANVLIMPDLNSGNILYKAMEHFGGFTAAGPILQGFNAPASDLSRGSSVEDVLKVIEVELELVRNGA
ncbi:hypothetical protein IJ798_03265 [Candidatus Saccharibacteria bacterium]|nr:hypothetical protein [Candidatus Saccharibacteria bacterium]